MPIRKPLRLKNYDYSKEGMYFVTICAQNRYPYFNDQNVSNMISKTWYELNHKYQNIVLDEFIVMPNHIHGIIVIVGADLRVRPISNGATHRSPPTLGEIIRWFKTMTTNYYIHGIHQYGWPLFLGKLWQRNYFEHIIRNDAELNNIRQYIKNNPLKYEFDVDNPRFL